MPRHPKPNQQKSDRAAHWQKLRALNLFNELRRVVARFVIPTSVIDDHTAVDRAITPCAKLVFNNCQLHHRTLMFIGHGPFSFETCPRQVPDSSNFAVLC